MSSLWSNEDTFKFIELYQAEPAIWNLKSELHRNKNKVNDAWNRIEYYLQIPVTELKKKKESLMTTFRLHFKKKQDSIRPGIGEGSIYKPIWVFYDVLEAFLKDVYECKSAVLAEADSELLVIAEEEDASGELSGNEYEIASDSDPLNIAESSPEVKGKVETPVRKRRAVQKPELENVMKAEKVMTNAFSALNHVLLNKDKKVEDDCELYGRLLACKLRRFSESYRQEIMYELDEILLKRRPNHTPRFVRRPNVKRRILQIKSEKKK